MDTMLSWVLPVFYGGLGNLAAYLAAHVLLCLLPAFVIAGAMAVYISQGAVMKHLGPQAPKPLAFTVA